MYTYKGSRRKEVDFRKSLILLGKVVVNALDLWA